MGKIADLSGQRVWVMAKGYHPDEGGMQTYAEGVANAYDECGAEVTVFTQTSAGPRTARIGNINLIDLGAGKSVLLPLRLRSAMRAEMRRSGPAHFVHGTTWRTSVMPMVLGLPYVTTFHGREFMYARGLTFALMQRVATRAQRCVAVSHFSAGRLSDRLGRLPRPVLVAWNGLSLWQKRAPSTAPSGAAPLIFSMCRLEPRKNILACVRACAALRDRGVPFRYVIAGRGPDLGAIHGLVEKYGLSEQIEVAGFVSAERAAQLYADADIFLHPQIAHDEGRDFEGFGIAIADAMSAGCAVIIGAEGGTPELVEAGTSGLVVDGLDPAALETALSGLLGDRARRENMAAAAQNRAQDLFTWQRHVGLILDGAKPGA